MQQAKSFDQVAFLEAIARRARVDLVLKPVRPGACTRMRSRFLGSREPDQLVIDVPETIGRKVFLPIGWDLGISFRIGKLAMQARTTVVDHCLFPLYPTRRVDGVVLQAPQRILTVEERQQPRDQIDPSVRTIIASAWPAERLAEGMQPLPWIGRLSNRSECGLGISFPTPLSMEPDTEVVVRLEEQGVDDQPLYRGVLRHCTRMSEGRWLAGFSDVQELGPGEAVMFVQALAGRPAPAGCPETLGTVLPLA